MQALEQLGIAHLASRNYQQLSGGEQQLALIARALAQQARILMMDEPTSSLDFGNQIRVHEQVCRLAQCGYTIMLSSHNPQHALSFADRVLTIQDGKLAADGRPEEVLSEEMMQALYGIEVKTIDSPYGRVVIPYKRER